MGRQPWYFSRSCAALDELLSDPTLDSHNVLEKLCEKLGLQKRELLQTTRQQPIVTYRHAACFLYRHLGYSFPQIGKVLRIDHSTALHAVRKIETAFRQFQLQRALNLVSEFSDTLSLDALLPALVEKTGVPENTFTGDSDRYDRLPLRYAFYYLASKCASPDAIAKIFQADSAEVKVGIAGIEKLLLDYERTKQSNEASKGFWQRYFRQLLHE